MYKRQPIQSPGSREIPLQVHPNPLDVYKRQSIIQEMSQDYARTAYSRGNSTRDVMYRHLLKNAMIPVVTFLGMALTDICLLYTSRCV